MHPGGYFRLGKKVNGEYIRRSLGHADRQKAIQWADRAAKQLAEGNVVRTNGAMTWGRLFALYRRFQTPKKVESGQREDDRRIEMWTRVLGGSRNPEDLTFGVLDTFIEDRRSPRGNRVTEKRKTVRTRTVQADRQFLNLVLNWGVRWRMNGEYLLRENPMRGFRIPAPKNPRRPVMTHDRLLKLKVVAEQLEMKVTWEGEREKRPTYFLDLLELADGTGRRITPICSLHTHDLGLGLGEQGAVVFPADTDKMGRENIVYLTPELRKVFDRILERVGGAEYLFPAPQDRSKPLGRELALTWLREAENLAGLQTQDGSAWHAIRRKFATERKHLPPQDVARVGGWKDLDTLLQVYQQPDEETQRRVLAEPRRLICKPCA